MAKANHIQPFPSGIDRDAFGHWLSGFTDGEGCFKLVTPKSCGPRVEFCLSLRADDSEILRKIQSYWGLGLVVNYSNARSKVQNAKPITRLTVYKIPDLLKIAEHFDKYPLRAKKSADFAIWKEALCLCNVVSKQTQHRSFRLNSTGTRNSFAGITSKWNPDQREKFLLLKSLLKEQRRFKHAEHSY